MKRIILIFLLACYCLSAAAQESNRDYLVLGYYGLQQIKRNPFKNMVNYHTENQNWEFVHLSKNCSVLKNTDGTQYYAGEVETITILKGRLTIDEALANKVIKSGKGVLKIIHPQYTEYISGTWEKDFLSGDALIRDTSGMVFFCKWKRGKIIKNSDREATEEEKNKLRTDIDIFESKIRLSGL